MISDRRLCQIAAQAYVGPWQYVSEGHTRAIRVDEDGYVVVAIEGTTLDNLAILRDIRFLPWWNPRVGFCPAGFLKGAMSIVDLICIDLASELKAGKVIFVGHSLGGAIAFILAAWFVAMSKVPEMGMKPPAAVVAFDPARSGWFKLRRLISEIAYAKYTWNGVDIVPWVPLPYLHPARCEQLGQNRNRFREIWKALRNRKAPELCPALVDHRIVNIEAALEDAGRG